MTSHSINGHRSTPPQAPQSRSPENDDPERAISQRLPTLLDRLFQLAEGVQCADKKNGDVYEKPPDRQAIEYLLNRYFGRPVAAAKPGERRDDLGVAAARELVESVVIALERFPDARAAVIEATRPLDDGESTFPAQQQP